MSIPLLSILIWLPIIGGGLVLLSGAVHFRHSKAIALLFSLASLVACVLLWTRFDASSYAWQFVELIYWVPYIGLDYSLAVDGISMPLVMLTCFITFVTILATWHSINNHISYYLACLLILQGILVGVFTATNVILFYIFWEATLIPMYLIIGIWGSGNKIYAAQKFFIFTFFGSALFLSALIYLGVCANSFYLLSLYEEPLSFMAQLFVFVAFFFGFAIKIPMWPLHTWLPHAHTEAPAGGSVLLAGILLKMGAYGFIRFSLPIVPDACSYLAWPMIVISLIAIVYIAIVALVQQDLKKLIAYSSVSHMGFVTLGCFATFLIYKDHIIGQILGLTGAIIVMLSHAFISGALFIGVGYIYDRLHTRNIADLSGIANAMPKFAAFFMLFALANVGVPGTSGFVGEFMVLLGTMQANFGVAFIAASTVIFSAAYTLWMYKRVMFGSPKNDAIAELSDISGMETCAFALLAGMVVLLGVYPAPLVEVLQASVGHLVTLASTTKLT